MRIYVSTEECMKSDEVKKKTSRNGMIHDYKTYALATEHDDTLSILRCVANPTNHI